MTVRPEGRRTYEGDFKGWVAALYASSGFFETLAEGIAERAFDGRYWTDDELHLAVVEEAKTEVKEARQNWRISPRAPAEDLSGVSRIPSVRKHDAYLGRGMFCDFLEQLLLTGDEGELRIRRVVPHAHPGRGQRFGPGRRVGRRLHGAYIVI